MHTAALPPTSHYLSWNNTMKQRSIIAAMAALALICISSTTFAQAISEWYPIDGIYYNPCCDEWVSIKGKVHLSSTRMTNSDGSVTSTVHFNLAGVKGTGQTSGMSYNFMENGSDVFTFNPDTFIPFNDQFSFTDRLVGKGRGGRQCSAKVKVSGHFAVDADGNIVIDEFSIQFICANGNTVS